MKAIYRKIAVATIAVGGMIVGIVFLLLFVIAAFFFIAWLMTETPVKPEISEAKFKCQLIYEYNGETITINDIMVCKYEGMTDGGLGVPRLRRWNLYFESTGQECIILLDLSCANKDTNDNLQMLFFYPGSGGFYMGETYRNYHSPPQSLDKVMCAFEDAEGKFVTSDLSSEIACNKYGIKLISWQYEPLT